MRKPGFLVGVAAIVCLIAGITLFLSDRLKTKAGADRAGANAQPTNREHDQQPISTGRTRPDELSKGQLGTTGDKTLVLAALSKVQGGGTNATRVLKLLASNEGKQRESAGAMLAEDGSEDAVELLLAAIKAEQDPTVRENLIELLRTVNNPAAIPALASQAQDLSDLALHRVCRNVMSAMNDPAAASQLVGLLESGGNRKELEPIAYAVSHLTSERAVPALVTGASSTSDRVARASIQGLGSVASTGAYAALFDLIAKNEGSERSQVAAVVVKQAAVEKKDAQLVAVSDEVISKGSSVQASQAAIDSLVATGTPEALAVLERHAASATNTAITSYLQNGIARYKALWSR